MIRIKIRKEIDRKKYLLFAILSFVFVLAAWLIASESGAIKEIFLPKPQNVVRFYIESIKDGSLLENTGISIYRITLGLCGSFRCPDRYFSWNIQKGRSIYPPTV